jgi:hypothetical protein
MIVSYRKLTIGGWEHKNLKEDVIGKKIAILYIISN